MQKFIHICKRRLDLWRINRDCARIHRQALRKARLRYETIPLRDAHSYHALRDLNERRAAVERARGRQA